MRTENLAIVFIDIAGFTPRTSNQTREENLQMLRRFDGIVRPLVRCYSGRVIKTIGDAYLLTFRSPTDALLCSMAIHDRIAETDAALDPADRFTIRAAVNVGEVRIDGGDVYGEAVNIASRIEGKAGAGEIYFSESVYLSMTRTEVPSEEVGYAELKGISGKVRLYRVPRADEAGGYSLKQRGNVPGQASGDEGVPAVASLPFGGHGLDRVRDRMSAGAALAPALDHVQGLVQKTPDAIRKAGDMANTGFHWWRSEVRHSRAVQYGTIAVVIILIITLAWGVWFKKSKPKTPWQKFQNSLGF
ncbi:MAG: adenylate/guanylate cyclase domain-containing protein [Nitrospirota bacterium]|nr:adenylate/guanylate cyclase domain-containing protein [Nitrospirota bacterium]